jgi:Flp pilus assembly protein TadD
MKRAVGAALLCTILSACAEQSALDDLFAPGVDRGAEGDVDQLLVGQRLVEAGEYDSAIKAYSRAAVSQGMSAPVLAGIGTASIGLGRLHTAEDHLRRAIDIDEDEPEYWNNLGVTLIERGNAAEAEQMFRRAYALDNGQSDAIRDNLRLALEKIENPGYSAEQQQEDYKLVRRGSHDYKLHTFP